MSCIIKTLELPGGTLMPKDSACLLQLSRAALKFGASPC